MGIHHLYARLPVWAQHAAVTSYGAYRYWARFGGTYAADVATFASRDGWATDRWRSSQRETVTALLTDAAAHVPYYRDAWGPEERRELAAALDAAPRQRVQP